MSATLQKQFAFSRMLPQLLVWLHDNGYEVTGGEWQRTAKQAAANAASGSGISNSLHISSLAIDLHLFKDGVYLDKSEDYAAVGEYWESIGGSWGGRFINADGNHFSLAHNGVR